MFWLLATFWKQEKNCYNVAAWCKVAYATYSIQSFFSYNPSKTIKDWRILLALKSSMENVCLYIRYHVQNWTISNVFSDFRHFRVAEPYHIVFTPEEIWCRSINFSNMQEQEISIYIYRRLLLIVFFSLFKWTFFSLSKSMSQQFVKQWILIIYFNIRRVVQFMPQKISHDKETKIKLTN